MNLLTLASNSTLAQDPTLRSVCGGRSARPGQFGSYRARDLVLAYMSALSAGDTETVVDL